MLKKYALMAALVLVLAPASARADWLFTPNVGASFGGSAANTGGSSNNGNEHVSWGASIGWMGAGVFGWEADLAYTPEFFEQGDGDVDFIDNSNATSWMANVIIGVPVGGQRGGGFRPYLTGGAGVLQTNVQGTEDLFEINNNEFGVNLGAGAFGFMSDHVGLRGDIRYFRALSDPDEDNEFDVGLGDLDFWRGTVGVAFRW
jgi:opacity protein-like surface antigen